jgi:hypothetical protein
MTKIDFTKLEMFLNIEKTEKETVDVRSSFANMIYSRTNGIECHSLAYKIYNSEGEEEFSDKECEIIRKVSEYALPKFIDAIKAVLS